ncbi:UNVERIFIED_CONTAM: hypothetical protein FKN15_063753 [Acipenser sinensis]
MQLPELWETCVCCEPLKTQSTWETETCLSHSLGLRPNKTSQCNDTANSTTNIVTKNTDSMYQCRETPQRKCS